MAVLCHLRDAFRAGDIWLAHSRRYGDLKDALVPAEVARATPKLAMPFEPEIWLADRKSRLADSLQLLARAARAGAIPGGSIEDGVLKIDRLTAAVPEEADAMVLDLYKRLPEIRITDLLLEVDDAIGFTEAFTHLRTGVPCKDRVGMLNVLLAEGLNLGLSQNGRGHKHPRLFPTVALVAVACRKRGDGARLGNSDRRPIRLANGPVLGAVAPARPVMGNSSPPRARAKR